jgi:hypothetical protein
MKRVIFFITHATLTHEHAEMCLKALGSSVSPPEFDRFIVYNTHSHELSNEAILQLYEKYDLTRFINEVDIFDYNPETPKTLAGDVNAIREWCLKNLDGNDRVLMLKSDILVSERYLEETTKTDRMEKVLFIPTLFNAKRSVPDEELTALTKVKHVIRSGPEFFFMEDESRTKENDNRDRGSFSDPEIKYLVCTCKRDWSCPYITVSLLPLIQTTHKTWGGWNAEGVSEWWIGGYMSFTVHKWHGIVSTNNRTERPGTYGEWLNS